MSATTWWDVAWVIWLIYVVSVPVLLVLILAALRRIEYQRQPQDRPQPVSVHIDGDLTDLIDGRIDAHEARKQQIGRMG